MKKIIIPLILISSIFLVLIINSIITKVIMKPKIAEGFTITQFDTDIEVYGNNTYSVDEHITVNWEKNGYPGLVRIIPNANFFTSQDGKSYDANLGISTLRTSEQYSTFEKISHNQLKLTIGKPGETAQLGSHTYQIMYDGNFGNDPHKGFDELIFHAYGDNWGTKINKPSFSITLPYKVKNPQIRFFADKHRKYDVTQNFSYSEDGRTIKAIAEDDFYLDGSLTIDIVLPDGYFTNTQNIYPNFSVWICIFSLAVCIIIFILCIIFLKNNPKVKIDSSNSYPPKELDSSQLGYIFKTFENNKKLSVSLIISLASKGYIKIFDVGNNQYNIFNITVKDSTSLKNQDNIPIPEELEFNDITTLTPLSKNEKLIFYKLFEKNDVNAIYNDTEFYTVFDKIGKKLKSTIGLKMNDKKFKSFQLISWVLCIVSQMLMVVGYYALHDIEPQYQFLYIIGWVSCIISIILSIRMGIRELYGITVIQRINDFKNFIENSEISEFELLVKNDPTYFYTILPYAYVLGINKKLIDKFKSISIPDEVHTSMDTVNYFDYYIIDNISDNLRYPVHEEKENG